jgi:hypothetical protein
MPIGREVIEFRRKRCCLLIGIFGHVSHDASDQSAWGGLVRGSGGCRDRVIAGFTSMRSRRAFGALTACGRR